MFMYLFQTQLSCLATQAAPWRKTWARPRAATPRSPRTSAADYVLLLLLLIIIIIIIIVDIIVISINCIINSFNISYYYCYVLS